MMIKPKQRYLVRFRTTNGDRYEVEVVESSKAMATARAYQDLREWIRDTKHVMASRDYWGITEFRILENGE